MEGERILALIERLDSKWKKVPNEPTEIRLLVKNEKDLYTRFSPEDEFEYRLKNYLRSKIACSGFKNSIRLTVLSPSAIDENRFRAAVSNWIRDERAVFQQEASTSKRLLTGLLIIASILITMSLALVEHFSVLSYTIIPVLGSVALGKAAAICITELPIINIKLKLLREMEKNNAISFVRIEPEPPAQ